MVEESPKPNKIEREEERDKRGFKRALALIEH